jgi:hypothetical protein
MKLSKFTQKQLDQALAVQDEEMQSRMLSVIHRCGNTKERKAVDNIIMQKGLCPKYLVLTGGCFVMRGDA